MSSVTIGLVVSIGAFIFFATLFSYEARTGKRFFVHVRVYADMAVLRISRALYETLGSMGRDLIRLARYTYHQVLRAVLVVTRRCEESLRNAIRTNKTIAKTQEEESSVRSQLEEVAFHKATVALSEEEKRRHKDKMLEG